MKWYSTLLLVSFFLNSPGQPVPKEANSALLHTIGAGNLAPKPGNLDEMLKEFKNNARAACIEADSVYMLAGMATEISRAFIVYVDTIITEIVKELQLYYSDSANKSGDVCTDIFIRQGRGRQLKDAINNTRQRLLDILDKQGRETINSDLATENPGDGQTWEEENFKNSPAASAITILVKTKNDCINTNSQVLDALARRHFKNHLGGSFDGNYPFAAVSADAMNVFYVGLDNPLSVAVSGVSPEAISVTVSNGQVKKGGNMYFVNVYQKGETEIRVAVETESTAKNIGAWKFRVKNLPLPQAQLGSIKNGAVAGISSIRAASRMLAFLVLDAGFTFEGVKFKITSFTFGVVSNNSYKTVECTGDLLSEEAKNLVAALQPGDKILIDKIKCSGPGLPADAELAPVVVTVKLD